jgi:hypothetical protein
MESLELFLGDGRLDLRSEEESYGEHTDWNTANENWEKFLCSEWRARSPVWPNWLTERKSLRDGK